MSMLSDLFNADDSIVVDKDMIRKIGMREAVTLQVIEDMVKDNEFITHETLKNELTFFGEKALKTLLDHLVINSYITINKLEPSDKLEILKRKNLQGMGIGEVVCPCCGGKTLILHSHHYPVPRHMGGTETIKLCPGCHYEYHYLDMVSIIRLRKAV